jgi:hypothetical protein
MNTQKEVINLAKKSIVNPTLLKTLPEDVMFDFVMAIVLYDINLTIKLEELRPLTNPNNKVLFWEAAGILMPQESFV